MDNLAGTGNDTELSPPSWVEEDVPLSEYHVDYGAGEGDDAPPAFYPTANQSPYDDAESEPVAKQVIALPSIEVENRIVRGLNDEQRVAVTMPVNIGPMMVLAGAGTGKTAVLTRRIAYLSASGVGSRHILAVTFTNKAAREMRERLEKLGVSPMPLVGTFHAIGLRILKICPEAAGVDKHFTVMDESDTEALWKRLFVAKKGEMPDESRMQLPHNDKKIRDYMGLMFNMKEQGIRSSKANDAALFKPFLGKMLDLYEAERRAMNLVDFSDLISASLEAIEKHEAGRRWSGNFSHVLVDEFQDTSDLQFRWARAIMAGRDGGDRAQNLFCVGDDSQSIYSFRGAEVANIESFIKGFDAIEVKLEQNYRCGTDILEAANSLIGHNPNGLRKKLWADADPGSVEHRPFLRDFEEAEWIAEDLKVCDDPQGAAILVRTRAAMIPIMSALRFASVPYHVVGAQDFFARREIRDAMALLRFAANPADQLSFTRVAGLYEGVGKTTVDRIVAAVRETGLSAVDLCKNNKSEKVRAIGETFQGVSGLSPVMETMGHLLRTSGLWDACEADEDRARLENLKEFVEIGGQFQTIAHFLEEMTLFAEKKESNEGVTVSTIHAAKGLEWERVYLPALAQGHLPSERADMDPERAQADLEEERRLMYVAITRAKRTLRTSWSKTRLLHGQIIDTTPSQFLRESAIDARTVERDEPRTRYARAR